MSKAWLETKVLRRAEMRAENRRVAGFLMDDVSTPNAGGERHE